MIEFSGNRYGKVTVRAKLPKGSVLLKFSSPVLASSDPQRLALACNLDASGKRYLR